MLQDGAALLACLLQYQADADANHRHMPSANILARGCSSILRFNRHKISVRTFEALDRPSAIDGVCT